MATSGSPAHRPFEIIPGTTRAGCCADNPPHIVDTDIAAALPMTSGVPVDKARASAPRPATAAAVGIGDRLQDAIQHVRSECDAVKARSRAKRCQRNQRCWNTRARRGRPRIAEVHTAPILVRPVLPDGCRRHAAHLQTRGIREHHEWRSPPALVLRPDGSRDRPVCASDAHDGGENPGDLGTRPKVGFTPTTPQTRTHANRTDAVGSDRERAASAATAAAAPRSTRRGRSLFHDCA